MIVNIVLSVPGLFVHSPQGLGKKTKVQLYLQKNLLHGTKVKHFPFPQIFERAFSTLTREPKSPIAVVLSSKHMLPSYAQRSFQVCFRRQILSLFPFRHDAATCVPFAMSGNILLPCPLRRQESKGVTLLGPCSYCLTLGHCTQGNINLLYLLLMSSNKGRMIYTMYYHVMSKGKYAMQS